MSHAPTSGAQEPVQLSPKRQPRQAELRPTSGAQQNKARRKSGADSAGSVFPRTFSNQRKRRRPSSQRAPKGGLYKARSSGPLSPAKRVAAQPAHAPDAKKAHGGEGVWANAVERDAANSSEYELTREANIRNNEAELAKLGLTGGIDHQAAAEQQRAENMTFIVSFHHPAFTLHSSGGVCMTSLAPCAAAACSHSLSVGTGAQQRVHCVRRDRRLDCGDARGEGGGQGGTGGQGGASSVEVDPLQPRTAACRERRELPPSGVCRCTLPVVECV